VNSIPKPTTEDLIVVTIVFAVIAICSILAVVL
jgi:hypothetical protein